MYGGSPYNTFPDMRGVAQENSQIFTLSHGEVQRSYLIGVKNPLSVLQDALRAGSSIPIGYFPLLTDLFQLNCTVITKEKGEYKVVTKYKKYPNQRDILIIEDGGVRVVGRLSSEEGAQPLVRLRLM